MTLSRHDAHVRTHRKLIQRVVNRWYEWNPPKRLLGESYEQRQERMEAAVAKALTEFSWPHEWWVKRGRYDMFYGAPVVGVYTQPPAPVIHMIMCDAARFANRKKAS